MKYDVIYADPPWSYNSRKAGAERKDKTKFGGGAEKHYPLMTDTEILAMRPMVDNWTATNCALFLWATCPRIDSAIDVLKGWGFRYCTVAFVWVKRTAANGLIYNPGYYTASNAEVVLLGCRGSMRPDKPMIQQVVEAPRRAHSQKPDEVRRRIEAMYPGALRLELFARTVSPGWDAWGNEIDDGKEILPPDTDGPFTEDGLMWCEVPACRS
jgi:N6-adenosine-specific RNA methylase IME4